MASQGLTGLTGIAGFQVVVDENSQATPEQRMGNPVDPAHAEPLAQPNIPRGSRLGTPVGPHGPENQLLGDEFAFWESGGDPSQDPEFDHTPNTHAGPWLKGVQSGPVGDIGPDATALKLQQSYRLHGLGTGAAHNSNTSRSFAQNDEWQEIWNVTAGHSDLITPPKQQQSSGFGWGTRDRTQSMAEQNEFGFDSAHYHRRIATGSIPGNTMWMKPGGRPMVKSLAGPARPPIGPDSPFYGQDLGQAFSVDGAVLQNVPTEYVPPAQPQLQQAPAPDSNDSYVEWY